MLLWALFHLRDIGGAFAAFGEYLQYKFIRRAMIVGALVSLCASLLGVTLVLKRYSMIGDGLSHVGFGALTVAMALGFVTAESLPTFLPSGMRGGLAGLCGGIAANPLPFTLVIVVLCAFLLLRVSERSGMRGDSAIALISTSALAVGVIVTSMTSGMNVDVYNYMFGSILAMSSSDVWLSAALSVVVLVLFVLFYPRIFAVTFDEPFARATGVKAGAYNLLIALLTALTVVVGMRMMGTLLISSLIIFPALSSMRVFSRFKSVTVCAAVISVGCFLMGMMLSCVYSLPTGAGIVAVNLFVFIVFSAIGAARG
ncbi:MAG: metal ABC transporter permease [Clostridia bacterium]|nr:metal ABC transporter permease [Clostridia bacterium]